MASRIRLIGDPILRTPAARVTDRAAARPCHEALLATLADFRKKNGFGRAIAAPQIGHGLRMIAVHLQDEPFVMYNPEITRKSEEMFSLFDDCFSFPWLLVPVQRHVEIDVSYETVDGDTAQMRQCPRSVSELLQHEIDHLDGVLSTDRALKEPGIIARSVFAEDPEAFLQLIGSDYAIKMT